jgi:hypothetical protein
MYDYKPLKVSFSASVKKLLIIAWVCALLLLPLLYFTATGKVTVDDEKMGLQEKISLLERSRSACDESLQKKTDLMSNCLLDVQSCNSLLTAKSNQLIESQPNPSQNDSVSYYKNLLTEANRTISQCEYTFEMVVMNSARQICCIPGADTASFTVENYRIKCSGSYVIDCTTGKLI